MFAMMETQFLLETYKIVQEDMLCEYAEICGMTDRSMVDQIFCTLIEVIQQQKERKSEEDDYGLVAILKKQLDKVVQTGFLLQASLLLLSVSNLTPGYRTHHHRRRLLLGHSHEAVL